MVATLEKPAGITLEEVLKEKGPMLLKAAAVLFAVGLSNEQVEDILEIKNVGEQLRSTTVAKSLRIQLAMGMSPEKRIAAAQNAALDVKMKLLHEGDSKTQLAVSTDLLDRHMGKAVQTTQSINTNLNVATTTKELDDRLNKMQLRLKQISDRKLKLVGPI